MSDAQHRIDTVRFEMNDAIEGLHDILVKPDAQLDAFEFIVLTERGGDAGSPAPTWASVLISRQVLTGKLSDFGATVEHAIELLEQQLGAAETPAQLPADQAVTTSESQGTLPDPRRAEEAPSGTTGSPESSGTPDSTPGSQPDGLSDSEPSGSEATPDASSTPDPAVLPNLDPPSGSPTGPIEVPPTGNIPGDTVVLDLDDQWSPHDGDTEVLSRISLRDVERALRDTPRPATGRSEGTPLFDSLIKPQDG